MSRTKSPAIPAQSIKRLFEEVMKTHAATAKGTYVQFARQRDPQDYDSEGNYLPLPLFDHLYAVAYYLGGDVKDRFMECMEATETVAFRPENWVPDEDDKQAAE
jgi:hypothetical protein